MTLFLRFALAAAMATGPFACAGKQQELVGGVEIQRGASFRILPTEQLARQTAESIAVIHTDVGRGLGFIVDKDGYLITNRHVIEDSNHIESITFPGSRTELKFSSAHIEYIDAEYDLALIKIDHPEPLPALALATDSNIPAQSYLGPSDDIMVFRRQSNEDEDADPRVEHSTVGLIADTGKVQALGVYNKHVGPAAYVGFDVPIQKGQSGGPLVDRFGRVVGIVTWTWRDQPGGFAIPIGDVVRTLTERPRLIDSEQHRTQARGRAITFLKGLNADSNDVAKRVLSPSYAREIRSQTLTKILGDDGSPLLIEYQRALDLLLTEPRNIDAGNLFRSFTTLIARTTDERFLQRSGFSASIPTSRVTTFFFEYGQAYLAARYFGDLSPDEATTVALRRLHSLDAARSFALAEVFDHLTPARMVIENTEIVPGAYAPQAVITVRLGSGSMPSPHQAKFLPKLAVQMRYEWGDWYVAEIQAIGIGTTREQLEHSVNEAHIELSTASEFLPPTCDRGFAHSVHQRQMSSNIARAVLTPHVLDEWPTDKMCGR